MNRAACEIVPAALGERIGDYAAVVAAVNSFVHFYSGRYIQHAAWLLFCLLTGPVYVQLNKIAVFMS